MTEKSMKNEHQHYIKLVKKFISKLEIKGKEDCWLWRGEKNDYGIGFFYEYGIPRYLTPVHNLAYLMWHKDDPRGKRVMHTCGYRSCCNPKHLYVKEYIGVWKDFNTMLEKNH